MSRCKRGGLFWGIVDPVRKEWYKKPLAQGVRHGNILFDAGHSNYGFCLAYPPISCL
jgi:hypothetical protein